MPAEKVPDRVNVPDEAADCRLHTNPKNTHTHGSALKLLRHGHTRWTCQIRPTAQLATTAQRTTVAASTSAGRRTNKMASPDRSAP